MPDPPTGRLDDQALRRLYREGTSAPDAHPPEAVLGALIRGSLGPAEREVTLDHVGRCAECAALLQHVSRCEGDCAPEFQVRPIKAHAPRAWGLWGGLAAAVLAAMVLWLRPSPPDPRGSSLSSPAPPPSRAVATLRDGARQLHLTADGRVEGLMPGEEGLGPALAEALRTGRLPLPADLAGLQSPDLVLMGEATESAFRVWSPLGTVVRTDRPTLRWTPVPGASYIASVLREDLTPVEKSPSLQTTEWTPRRPLARGETYVWQVAAETPAGRRVAPAPPAGEARFRVLDPRSAATLEQSLGRAGDSLLIRGYLLARAGVIDEAEQAFATLLAGNPGSAEAARLLETLRRAHPGPATSARPAGR
jgi:hypothetical protein